MSPHSQLSLDNISFNFSLRKSFISTFALSFLISINVYAQSSAQTDLLRGNGMMFTENKGQIIDTEKELRPDVLFKGYTKGLDIYLRKTGISYVQSSLNEIVKDASIRAGQIKREDPTALVDEQKIKQDLISQGNLKLNRIDLDFENCNQYVEIKKSYQVEGVTNYYLPHCKQGILNLNSYNQITYENIYKNIDIKCYGGKERGLKYDIIIKPGGNPSDVKLKYNGIISLKQENNELKIFHSLGTLTEQIPKAYQLINGEIVDIGISYLIKETTVQFELKNYNRAYPVVIDPWASYYGGSGDDKATSVTTDANGNIIFTGYTTSNPFPLSAGPMQNTYGGNDDAFVVKMSSAGNLIWATYYGSSGNDDGRGIICDGGNNVIVSGKTDSGTLPVSATGGNFVHQAAIGGGASDAFLIKLDPTGALIWSTFYGGTDTDIGCDVACNGTDIYLYGQTLSLNAISTAGAFQTALNGAGDVFVVKFTSTGARTWGTYVGGNDIEGEWCGGITCDPLGNIYICGSTRSTTFPALAGHQMAHGGTGYMRDAFLFKFNPAGAQLWATYYGGTDWEMGYAVVTDSVGNVIIAGDTGSPNAISSAGSHQPVYGGGCCGGWGGDGFVVKFNSAGTRLWGTYLGGNRIEYLWSLATDQRDNIFVFGDIEDFDVGNFPISSCAIQTTFYGSTLGQPFDEDQIIAKYDSNGVQKCVTFLGGTGEDDPGNEITGVKAMTLFQNSLYITGWARQGGYPVTPGAFQTAFNGGGAYVSDAFINNVCKNICEAQTLGLDFSANPTNICAGKSVAFTSIVNSSCDTSEYQYIWTFPGGSPSYSSATNPTITYLNAGSFDVKLLLITPCKRDSITKTAHINVSSAFTASITPTNVLCGGNNTGTAIVNPSIGGSFTYLWSNAQTTQTASNLAAGTYSVIVFDINGCAATQTITITSPSVLSSTLSITNTNCTSNDGSITASPSGGTSPYTYSWSNAQTGQTISNLAVGNYTLTLTDDNGCTYVITANVNGIGSGTVSTISIDPQCNGVATGTASATVSGGTSPFTYSWSNGGTNQSISNLGSGVYTVTIADGGGCVTIDSVTISEPPPLSMNMSPSNTICAGANTTLTAAGQGGSSGYNYLWSTSNSNASITEQPTLTTIYSVTVTDANGCSKDSSITITVTTPTVEAGPGTTILSGESTTLSASGNGAFSWNPSTSCTCANPTVSPTSTTTYTLTITVDNCSVIDTVTIYVEKNECDENTIYIPNGFSPNEDGENDVLKMFVSGKPEALYFAIYSRWGEKVFETTDYKAAWNGYYKNKLMDAAVYSYILKINCSATNTGTIKTGNISLVR